MNARYFSSISAVHIFLKENGVRLKRNAKISGFGTIIGKFMIDKDQRSNGYYLYHYKKL